MAVFLAQNVAILRIMSVEKQRQHVNAGFCLYFAVTSRSDYIENPHFRIHRAGKKYSTASIIRIEKHT